MCIKKAIIEKENKNLQNSGSKARNTEAIKRKESINKANKKTAKTIMKIRTHD